MLTALGGAAVCASSAGCIECNQNISESVHHLVPGHVQGTDKGKGGSGGSVCSPDGCYSVRLGSGGVA
jgi:hypothetical protein